MTLDLSIYLVTDSSQTRRCGRSVVRTVQEAVAGGVTTVQVREKHAEAREVLNLVEALVGRLPAHVTVLINDRIDIYQVAKARGMRVGGVHVGQRDLPVEEVRALVGAEAVIGLTANTPDDLTAAQTSPARVDYVGIGVVRETASKDNAPAVIGVAGVALLAGGCSLPAVAIGGIVPTDLAPLRSAGLAGAAVMSWVCASGDPRRSASELRQAWQVAA